MEGGKEGSHCSGPCRDGLPLKRDQLEEDMNRCITTCVRQEGQEVVICSLLLNPCLLNSSPLCRWNSSYQKQCGQGQVSTGQSKAKSKRCPFGEDVTPPGGLAKRAHLYVMDESVFLLAQITQLSSRNAQNAQAWGSLERSLLSL